MHRVWGWAWLTGAWLLLAAALLLFGRQQAISGLEVRAEQAAVEVVAWPAGATIIREDQAVVVVPTSLTVREPDGAGTFLLTLTSEPTATVSIPLSATAGECLVSPATVTLDAANWAAGETATVTAVDDAIVDGSETCLVQTGLTTSEDGNYQGLDPANVTVTVEDDDQASIVVSPTSLTVSEPSGSQSFVVRLTSQPAAGVSVPLSASNNQCSVSPGTILLNAGNWATGATATVTAVNDAVDDGNMSCLVQTGVTTSEDTHYAGLNPADVTVTVEDDDQAGVLVEPTSLTVSEPSGTGSFVIKLSSQPVNSVFVPLATSGGECSISRSFVWMTSNNWSTGVATTVTAIDDLEADGDTICLVEVRVTVSDDSNYQGLDPADVVVTVQDNDQAGVVVAPTSLAVSEPSGSGTVTLRLTSQPLASVSIPLSASNSQCSVAPATATLNAANWATGATATVAAVDDAFADGDATCVVQTGLTVSGDDDYQGLNPADVTVTVADDDEVNVLVAPTSLNVSEPSGSATFVLRLASQPLAGVSIPLSAFNSQCTVSPATILLNAGNWATGVTATVSAVNDAIMDGSQSCLVQTGLTASDDDNYQGLNPADVTVTVADDDHASIVVAPTSLTISEPAGSGSFVVRLTSQPVNSVYVPLTSSGGQCSISRSHVWLTPSNWSTGVATTATAVNDAIVDGDRTCLVEVGLTNSDDENYQGLDPEDVTVTVEDDDQTGVVVAPTSMTVSEPSGSGSFLVTLISQPAVVVSIPLSASNGQCSVSPATLLLHATNWATGATATVAAVNDAIADGDANCLVQTGLTVSDDRNYQGIDPADVTVLVGDDDRAGVLVAPTNLTVREPDGSGSVIVSLSSEPTATVSIALSPSNDQCEAAPRSVILEAGNWQTGVTVSVTAQDDDLPDGSQICVVHSSLASSAAPQYHGLEVDDVTVTVQDDEVQWQAYLPVAVRGWPPVPGTPVLRPISNPGGLGTYTVAWDATAGAETYILEEAKVRTFAASQPIYDGTASSYQATGRGAARYYYRVKARNTWGDSGWSNVQQVDVLWEAEPNDDALTQAHGPIVSGLTYYGTFPDAADLKDYFYFDLGATHSVELQLTNIASGQNYDLILRNSSLEDVGYSALPSNLNEHILIPALPAGRYYVQVYRYSGAGSDQPYNLRVVYE
ncbi:MAG TPA: PPC domain-containing protein [Anaerolineae bacterium]|nr:PPC domain-containing protein [Anaerolineae bacterium]